MKYYNALRGAVIKKGMTLNQFAGYLGISPSHLSEKLSRKYEFKQSEIDKTLELTGEKYEDIFLAP